jgi:hypothetical protein
MIRKMDKMDMTGLSLWFERAAQSLVASLAAACTECGRNHVALAPHVG